MSRQTISLVLIVVALTAPRAQGQEPQAEPYSRLTFRGGLTSARTFDPLHQYYPGDRGVALELETPFEFGLVGISVDAVTMRGATSAQVTTVTKAISFEWLRRLAVFRTVNVRAGGRVGDFHMLFRDPHFNDPGANPDHGTEEFLIGPTGAVDVRLPRSFGVTLSGSWIYLPSATAMKVGYASLLGSCTMTMPAWLKHFIE